MSNLGFNAIPSVLADAFRNDPNKYLSEFEFYEVNKGGTLWRSPKHLRYNERNEFGAVASDGNGSNILVEDEKYKNRRYVIFDGNGQRNMTFVDVYAAVHRVSFDDALDKAFEFYGVDRHEPQEVSKMRKMRNQLQSSFDKITEAAQEALNKDDEQDEALNLAKIYALNRFTKDEGIPARVGYISNDVHGMIMDLVRDYEEAMGMKVGISPNKICNRICAPIEMLGRTYGYICRKVEKPAPMGEIGAVVGNPDEPKYCNITFYERGKKPVYGLAYAKRGGAMRKPNVVIVEGEFACLKVRALTGLDNIVAIGQQSVTNYQASMIKKAGYESVTLFLDNDGVEKMGQNLKALEASVSVLHAEGLRVNAIRVEHEEDRKFAPDDEVMRDGGGKFVKGLIEKAPLAVVAIINILTEMYKARKGGTGAEDGDFIDECIEAIALYTFDDVEQAGAIKAFVSAFSKKWGVDEMMVRAKISGIVDEAKKAKGNAIEKSREDEAMRLCQEAVWNLSLGRQNDAKKSMALASAALNERHGDDFVRLLPPQSPDDILQDAQIGDPIGMPFYLTPNGGVPNDEYERDSYRYVVTSSGIDLISALTSHGKTRMLENIALNCISEFQGKNQQKQVLFFTAEEVRPSILCHFISINAGGMMIKKNARLGDYLKNPIVGIQKIFASKNYECVHGNPCNPSIGRDVAIDAIEKSIDSISKVVESGMLSIFRENRISEIEKITLASERHMRVPVGAIFVDYAQIIQSDSKFAQDPKLRIADVMNRLLLLAQITGAAVVVGSQLNRGKYTPLTMDCQNNALASDLEQIAFTDMLMWNSSGKLREDAAWNEGDDDVLRLKYLGFQLNTAGRIYARLGKNRRGDRGVWGVLNFDGPSGYIGGNTKESFHI